MGRGRLAMVVAVGATMLALVVATATRDARLFLIGAASAAVAAVIWRPRIPLE